MTGEVIEKTDWVVHDRFDVGHSRHSRGGVELASSGAPSKTTGLISSYLVYEWPVESPNHASPLPPADARTVQVDPQNSASPFGWHDTNGVPDPEFTTTQGNNVDAQKSGVEAECGPSLDCSFVLDLTIDPTAGSNVDAAIANLFYWNNIIHDVWHTYGFDEASGNFQTNNYGNGGSGNDAVIANAQAPGNCNANFGTPADAGRRQ